MWPSSDSSRRTFRARSLFRHTRATIVVRPAAEVLDPAYPSPADTQPGVLYGIVGFTQGAEHPIGHRP